MDILANTPYSVNEDRFQARVNYHIAKQGPADTSAENPGENRAVIYVDVNGETGKRIDPEWLPTIIDVEDNRRSLNPVCFTKDSVTFVSQSTKVANFDAAQTTWRKDYDLELTVLLQKTITAKEVVVFDHTVRMDQDAVRKPARHVHGDYSEKGAIQRLVSILGPERAAQWEKGHFALVNTWRPINQVVKTAPLGFIRSRSMAAEDWTLIDIIYPDRKGQIQGVLANENHQWVFLSDMTPEEISIFNVYDNQGLAPVAHSAIDLLGGAGDVDGKDHPRQSVESRILVRYA